MDRKNQINWFLV